MQLAVRSWLGGACLLIAATGCNLFREPRTQSVRAEHKAAGLEYVEVVPVGPDTWDPLPMVLLIHGLGDNPRADWIGDHAQPARYILPRAPLPHGTGFSWFPYQVYEKNPDLEQHVAAATEHLATFIKALRKRHPTAGKVIVAGFSQGGILAFALALRYPELIQTAQPVAGYLPTGLWPESPLPGHNPQIYATHGMADPVIPLEPTQAMIETLHSRGFNVHLEAVPGVGHTQTPYMKEKMEQVIAQAVRGREP